MLLACSKGWETTDQVFLEHDFMFHVALAGSPAPNLSGAEPSVRGQGEVSFTH